MSSEYLANHLPVQHLTVKVMGYLGNPRIRRMKNPLYSKWARLHCGATSLTLIELYLLIPAVNLTQVLPGTVIVKGRERI